MSPLEQWLVGAGNLVAGVLALAAMVWTVGVAERLVAAEEAAIAAGVPLPASLSVALFGWSADLTLTTSLLLAGAAGGVVGSLVQQAIVFASRAGNQTLEHSFVWWYVLRPVWSALLGAVTVLAVDTGLVSIGDESTSTAGLTVLVTSAVVAGLFTDQALHRLRSALGATDPAGPGR